MQSKKIIAVVGGTGSQGSGLVRAILTDPNSDFTARVICRDTNSAKAKEFAKMGAEVVSADTEQLDSVRKAFHGAYGAYCVTFLDHSSPEKELTQARNMAQAAKDEGLQHVIWSSLEDTRQFIPLSDTSMPTLMGKYKVPHFDVKGEANKIFAELGVPTTIFLTSFFWDNFINFGMGPKRGPNGELAITFPMGKKRLSGIATEDIGKCAYGIFKRGTDFIGKTVGVAGQHLTIQEMADSLTKALGQKVNYNEVSFDTYRTFGFPGVEDITNMFQFYHDCEEGFTGRRNLDLCKELNPELKTFDAWLAENAKKIPLVEI